MSYKNMGTFDLGRSVSGSAGAGKAATYAMDAAGIASGQAFLTSELEKRDTMIRTPLTSFTYARDLPIRVGGGLLLNTSDAGEERLSCEIRRGRHL